MTQTIRPTFLRIQPTDANPNVTSRTSLIRNKTLDSYKSSDEGE